jgi:hypothetical protein
MGNIDIEQIIESVGKLEELETILQSSQPDSSVKLPKNVASPEGSNCSIGLNNPIKDLLDYQKYTEAGALTKVKVPVDSRKSSMNYAALEKLD